MTGLVRKATLFSACGLLIAGAAVASVPSPANSTIPDAITVVGTHGGPAALSVFGGPIVDPAGTFQVEVRDLANNPLANSSVVIDFSNASDIVLCQYEPAGQQVDCITKTVRGVTNISGQVTLTVIGGATNAGPTGGVAAPGAGVNAVRVFADGVLLGSIRVTAVADQNGAQSGGNGVNALDLSFFGGDLGSASLFSTYRARSDYNFDEQNSGLDLSAFAVLLGNSALGFGSGNGCPAGFAYCP